MRSVIVFIFLISFSAAKVCVAHDGHDDGQPPAGKIENGKILGLDQITYFDAGAEIEWAKQKLKRTISDKNQIIYQSKATPSGEPALKAADPTASYLELKVPGGELLKEFKFDHAGEQRDFVKVTSPDFSSGTVRISKTTDLPLKWDADSTSSAVKVIIECYAEDKKTLMGRLTVSTKDDGEFVISKKMLNQLPAGDAKIAIRRIWLGEFQSPNDEKQFIGVRNSVTIVANIKLIGD